MTFKQLEALYWVAQLGGFRQAAARLYTTQSAVSERIKELEEQLGVALFDRSQRAARLTDKGQELLLAAKRMLALRQDTLARLGDPVMMTRTLRLGVTELTAMTWLPGFIEAIHRDYPRVTVEPAVDMSRQLYRQLLDDELDLVIVPKAYPSHPALVSVQVGEVHNAFMCKPGLVQTGAALPLRDLSDHRMLVDTSGPGILYDEWFKAAGFAPKDTLASNSVVALLGLTLSGMGVSYFPVETARPFIEQGLLQSLPVKPELPRVPYVAMQKLSHKNELTTSIIALAQASYDIGAFFRMRFAARPARRAQR